METDNFKIDFLGIGASKSATTWIFDCIMEHPEVCTIKDKEIGFFNRHYDDGIEYYQSFFKKCSFNKLKGEFTPGYLSDPLVAKRIKHYFPDIKLIVCLRNPIERAYSQYRFDKKNDRICADNDFETALKLKPRLIEQGFYYPQLKRYLDTFPRENILILIYEDIAGNQLGFIQGIYRFLKISDSYIPENLRKRSNISLDYRFAKLHIFLYHVYTKLRLNRLFRKLNLESIPRFIKRLNAKPQSSKQQMSSKTRQYLQDIYREDIKSLEKLINRDLSFWFQ